MTQGVLDIIKAIDSGDSMAIDNAFNNEMASRISARLDNMRTDVAHNLFKSEQVEDEVVEEQPEVEASAEETEEVTDEVSTEEVDDTAEEAVEQEETTETEV